MATKQEKLERLRKLNRKQMEVVFYFCQNMTDDEIVAAIGVSTLKTLSARKTKIYEKLEINVPDNDKQNYLHVEYCELVSELVPTRDDLMRWRPSVVEENEEESEEDRERTRPPIEPQTHPRPTLGMRIFRRIFFTIIAILALGSVGYFAFRLGQGSSLIPLGNDPNLITSTSEIAGIAPDFSDTPVPSETLVPPPASPEATSTVEPTATSVPTITPNPNQFFNDFSAGLDPAWAVIFGNPIIVNEQLTASETTLISIGDSSWINYRIEFDIRTPHCVLSFDGDALGVRAADRDNMLLFLIASCDAQWYYVINGERKLIPNTNKGGIRPSHFTMTVEGNKFLVHLDSQLLVSIVDDAYQAGGIYFQLRSGTTYDNFSITLLNP